jgi:chaperonin cofactor prefoldin
MDEKQKVILQDIMGTILDLWEMHEKAQEKAATKAELTAFFDKIETRISTAKARIQDVDLRLANLEAELEDSESR